MQYSLEMTPTTARMAASQISAIHSYPTFFGNYTNYTQYVYPQNRGYTYDS